MKMTLPIRRLPVAILMLLSVAACSPQAPSSAAPLEVARAAGATSLAPIYAYGFESGLGGWTSKTTSGTGSWQVQTHPETLSIPTELNPFAVTLADNGAHLPAPEGVSVARFGDVTGTFIGSPYPTQYAKEGGSSSAPQAGTLTSPAISLAGVSKAQLEFHSWWEVEGVASTNYDLMQVRVSTDGTNFSLLGQLNPSFAVSQPSEAAYSSGGPAAAPVVRHYLYDLTSYAGNQIFLQFSFDSRDEAYNAFRGFTVDNVVVSGGEALAAPLLTAVSPGAGVAGDLITLQGANFQTGALFFLNATQVQPWELMQFGVDHAIIQMPSLAPGTYDVRVVNPDGQEFTLTGALVYSATPSPAINSVSPNSSNVATPQAVTLSGSNFVAGATVKVGTVEATDVNVVSATQATATFPALEAGAYNVTLTNSTGQSGTLYSAYTVADTSTLQLTAPTTGASLNAGSTFAITWTSSNAAAVDLSLFKGGVFVSTLATAVPASAGSLSWAIPASLAAGTDYQIKLATTQGTQTSTSGNFTIVELTEVPTSTVVSASPNPSLVEEAVTFSATVGPAISAGTVQFQLDGELLGEPVPVVDGVATLGGIAVPAGEHGVLATFSGSGLYLASSGSLTQTAGHRPVATAQSVSTDEDTALALVLGGTDGDAEPLTYELVDAPTQGSLTGTLPALSYLPAANFHGADSFTFRVSDGTFTSEVATVAITVSPVNDAPVTMEVFASGQEDSEVAITLQATDVDSAILSFTHTTPSHGSLEGTLPNLRYVPSANFHGTDSFTFTATDGDGASSTSSVQVTLTPVNDAPVAMDQTLTTSEEVSLPFSLLAADPDGDVLTYALVSQPAQGNVTHSAAVATYVPAPDFHGQESLVFSVSDPSGATASATVTFTVTPVNDAPVAQPQSVSLNEDGSHAFTLAATDVDGDPLTYAVVTAPQHGALTGTPPSVLYIPEANFHGADSFTFKARDGSVDSEIVTVQVTVKSINDAPTGTPPSVTTAEDTAAPITLTAADTEGDTLSWTLTGAPTHGTLSGELPAVVYTPAQDFSGSDAFTVQVSDGQAELSLTVSLTVTPVNDVPMANALGAATSEDTGVELVLTGSDVEGSPLTFAVLTQPAHGTLTGAAPNLRYLPEANFNGTDSFTFGVNDGALDSAAATVTLSISAVNDAPVAQSLSVDLNEDVPTALTLSASDVEGDALTWTLIEAPVNGSLSGTLPEVTYTPTADYHGPDSLVFQVSDGQAGSAPTTVTFNVGSVNDAPVAQPQSVSVNEDGTQTLTLGATDVDGDPLTYTVVASPEHGALTGTPPSVLYTPEANFHGADSFTFKANDGQVDSDTVTVQVAVKSINDAPKATPPSILTAEDTAAPISLTAADADGDTLTWTLVSAPAHGSLSGELPAVVYTPAQDFSGADSFTVQVSDGQAELSLTVTLTVTPINDVPVATALGRDTSEDTGMDLVLSGSDVESSQLTFAVQSQPSHGTLTGTAPNLRYTPEADFNGSDSFTFVVNDGTADSAAATVTLSISAVNDAPVAQALSVDLDEDVATPLSLTASDVDGDTLTWILIEAPANGSLTGTLPEVTYTPTADFHGPDSLVFQVTDGQAESAATTVSLNVGSVNDAPVVQVQALTTGEDAPVELTLAATDTEGDTLTFEVVAQPARGSLSGTAPVLTYSPAADYHGTDSFTFKANDGRVDSEVREITVLVQSINDVPVATAQAASTSEDQPVDFTVSGSDVEGDALTFSVASWPLHGTLSGAAPDLTYAPHPDFTGVDTFTFVVHDGQAESAPSSVTVTVGPINDAPVAEGSLAVTQEDTAVEVPLLATDVDGDALTYMIITAPRQGTLSGTAPALTFTPAANVYGADSFTFRVNDGLADSEVVTVSLEIGSVDDAPIATAQAVSLTEDMATDLRLHGTDTEGAALSYAVLTQPAHGTLSGEAPDLVYRPFKDYAGEDTFTFVVLADGVESAPAAVSITVQASEDSLAGGGVGCTSTGGALAPGMLAALAGLLLRRGRRLGARVLRSATSWLLLAALLAVPGLARAQTQLPRLETETLRLNPGAAASLVSGAGLLMEEGSLRVALTAHHERDPLVYFRDGERVGAIIGDRSTAHLGLGWAPLGWLELGLDLPVVLMQGGDDLRQYGLAPPGGTSVGTTTLEARAALWQQRRGGLLDLTAGLAMQLPLGRSDALASEDGLGLLPSIGVGRKMNDWLRLGAELAVGLRPSTTFDERTLNRSTVEAAVVAHTVGQGLRGELSWRTALPLAGGPMRKELLAGARLPVGRQLELYGMGGLGLGSAPGVPTFRLLAGFAFTLGRASPVALVEAPAPIAAPDCLADPAACPDQDLDRDSIANGTDRCPRLAGVAERQGCAPPVVALSEAPAPCPTAPGTLASERCPAVPLDSPAVAAINQQLTAELQQEQMFQVYRAKLEAGMTPALERLVALLQVHPEIVRVQVEGHTDTSGDAKQNLTLSQGRADSVRSYLLSRGIAAERVTAVGRGSARPLVSNETPEGREANRRVEVILGLAEAVSSR